MKKKAQIHEIVDIQMQPDDAAENPYDTQQQPQLSPKKQQRKNEVEAWQRWKENQSPEDFKFLLDSFQGLIHSQGNKFVRSGKLPKSYIEADLIETFHNGLETYDPKKGAALNTHLYNHLAHSGRSLMKYSNIGKIPEPRALQIGNYQAREATLQEILGRPPSTFEMADDLKVSAKDVELLRREMRKDIISSEELSGLSAFSEESPQALEHLQFIHMDLSPEQQVVLEHTYGLYGRQAVESNEDLARIMGISPQKVRVIKRQIARRYKRKYG